MTITSCIVLYSSGGLLGLGTMYLSKSRPFREVKWYEIVFTLSTSIISVLFWIAVTTYHDLKKTKDKK